jgi:acyl dehydratase
VRYFEDFVAGQVFELGERKLTKEELVAFAREYDPQPFHVDEEAGKRSMYGGLIASGWQTLAVGSRLFGDAILKDTAGLGSPGVEELRWLLPVRPGDVLSGRATVLETRASERNPARGTVRWHCETLNQVGEVVLSMKALMFFGRRPTR